MTGMDAQGWPVGEEKEQSVKEAANQRTQGHPLHGGESGGGEQLEKDTDTPPEAGGGDDVSIGFVHRACLSFQDSVYFLGDGAGPLPYYTEKLRK